MSRREVLRAGTALELLCCLPGAFARTLAFARDQEAGRACRYRPRRAPPG